MNERIKELIIEARIGRVVKPVVNKSAEVYPYTEISGALEKFAELIVAECVKVLVTGEGNEQTSDAIWDLEEVFGVDIGIKK